MNKNIDLTKILKGCPKGTKFYSPIFGEVELDHIYGCQIAMICVKLNRLYMFNAAGKYEMIEMGCSDSRGNYYYSDECLLFPSKEQRDWGKFVKFWDNPNVENKKFDLNTLQPYDKILARTSRNDDWAIEFYSGKRRNDKYIQGLVYSWTYVIPYNDETKHLRGTCKDCPEYYKWWEE